MSVETETNQKENGERRRRLRLGSGDVQYTEGAKETYTHFKKGKL